MPWTHENILLPFFESERHSGLGHRLRELREFDAAPKEDQIALQNRKIRQLLEHAHTASPYYRDLFEKARFNPAHWQPNDGIPLPALPREVLRSRGEDIKSRMHTPEQLRLSSTGGTTGPPMKLWRDLEGLRQKTALQYHLDTWAGFRRGDLVLSIWGAERDLALNPSWRWRIYQQKLMRRIDAPAGQINDSVFASFLDKLNRHRPKVLYGYSATMARFAEYVVQQERPYHRPKVVIVTAEALTDEDRQILEETFGCRVNEQYGSRDVGIVAADCSEHRGLHFHPAACFVEFVYLGESPQGPIYKLIITDLLNYGMPLIRYDTDDCVLLDDSECPCGRWFPRIRRIVGRALDNFLLPDGSQVPGIALTVQMCKVSGAFRNVQRVQVIQKDLDRYTIKYVAEGDEEAIRHELALMRDSIQDLLKTKVYWTFDRVPEIVRERSGKMRLSISEVTRRSDELSGTTI